MMKARTFLFILFILGITGGGWYYFHLQRQSGRQDGAEVDKSQDFFYTIKRGTVIIGINQSGNINASKKHKLGLEAAFKTKLLWIIDENKKVHKDEVLARFEEEELKERIEDLQLGYENLQKDMQISLEEKKILESSNKSALKAAEDEVTSAEDTLRKYCKFDRHKEKDNLNLKSRQAKEKFQNAEDAYHDAYQNFNTQSFKDKAAEDKAEKELETLKRKVEDEKTNYNNVLLDQKVFKRYTHPNKLKELRNKLEQSKLNLEKTKIKNASEMVQKEKAIRNLEIKIRKQKRDLGQHQEYLPMMQLKAPVDGVVIYGDPDRRWGNPDIKIGMDVYRKQVLITIPEMNNLIVEFDLPEQYRSKVKLGDKVVVTPDSIKNLKITGKISDIASLPVNMIHWDRTSPKIYKTKIELDQQNPRLVAGMSVQIELISEILKDVLFVPVESVFEEGGKFFVYEKTEAGKPKVVYIEVGASNENYVVIDKGLNEGDQVYLYRPFEKRSEM